MGKTPPVNKNPKANAECCGLEYRNTDLKKQKQMSDSNHMEAAALMNTENSYKTAQSLGKAISQVCEK